MVVYLAYFVHILSFFASWYCVFKNPDHYFIRKTFIYTVIALMFFYLVERFQSIVSAFNIETVSDLVVSPFTTIYHLYFFLLVTAESFASTWVVKKAANILILLLLLVFILIDISAKTMIFSYFYVDILIIILSVLFFKRELNKFGGDILKSPGVWIVFGYFIFSITFFPFAILVDYTIKTKLSVENVPLVYLYITRLLNLIPGILFYGLLLTGCLKYLNESKSVTKQYLDK
ncbi:MAG: hypothetical protein WAT19_01605 [Ferruginibacter sp.]